MEMRNHPTMTSKSDEWETPQALFDTLNEEFQFDLDPCASQSNHKCDAYYTLEDNGLEKSWGGGTECFAIHRIPRLPNGLKRHTANHLNQALS